MKTYLERLTELQNQIGYLPGELNTIALLGLFGEAGEVLNDTDVVSPIQMPSLLRRNAVAVAACIDQLKKEIRDTKQFAGMIRFEITDGQCFDIELADVLYYLNAIAINRGLTLEQLAEKSYNKVSKKLQIDISKH